MVFFVFGCSSEGFPVIHSLRLRDRIQNGTPAPPICPPECWEGETCGRVARYSLDDPITELGVLGGWCKDPAGPRKCGYGLCGLFSWSKMLMDWTSDYLSRIALWRPSMFVTLLRSNQQPGSPEPSA